MALHIIVSEWGQILDGATKGDGQPPGRIVLAEQHLGQRGAAFLARIPGLNDGVCVLVRPIHRQGTAVDQDDDQRLADGVDRLQQLSLHAREVEVRAVSLADALAHALALFAFQELGDADARDHHVCLARCLGGLHRVHDGALDHAAALGIAYLDLWAQLGREALPRRHCG